MKASTCTVCLTPAELRTVHAALIRHEEDAAASLSRLHEFGGTDDALRPYRDRIAHCAMVRAELDRAQAHQDVQS